MPAQIACANPACARKFGIPDGAKGKKIQCPFCKQIFLVSSAAPPASSAASALASQQPSPSKQAAPRQASAIKRAAPDDVPLATAIQGNAPLAKKSAAVSPARVASKKTARFRPLVFVAGVLVGCVLTAVAVGVLANAYGLLDSSGDGVKDKELAEELRKNEIQAAEGRQKAQGDAALIADLRQALAASNQPNSSDQSTIGQLRERLKAAEDAALKSEASVAALKTQIAGQKNLGEAALQQAKDNKAALEKALAQLSEIEKKAQRDATTLAALRTRVRAGGSKDSTFKYIDEHALAAPPEAEKSLEALADYLASAAIDDKEKARAIYRWITDRIVYDVEGVATQKLPNPSPELVLKTRLAVCDGFAQLYADLSSRMALKAAFVGGLGNRLENLPGQKPNIGLHAWNAVLLEDKWQLIDATHGCSGKRLSDEFKDVKDQIYEYYFLPPSERMVFTHHPENAKWQLVDNPLSLEEFKKMPAVRPEIWQFGVSCTAVAAQLRKDPLKGFVRAYYIHGNSTKLVNAPLAWLLESGKEYRFEFESRDFVRIFAIQGTNRQYFEKSGNEFQLTLRPQKGPLKICGDDNGKTWQGFLEYEVE